MFFRTRKKTGIATADTALPGRSAQIETAETHYLTGRPLKAPVPDGMAEAMFGMGCFWGVERMFWKLPGVWLTMVGYAGGPTRNPTYKEVCSGKTGHNEVVRVIYDPAVISYESLLKVFWEGHNPSQGMRQGNDVGTQYRSGIYTYDDAQAAAAVSTRETMTPLLVRAGLSAPTTEILSAPEFFYAEEYHQQYLAKNPGGYCGIGGTGVTCPIGTGVVA